MTGIYGISADRPDGTYAKIPRENPDRRGRIYHGRVIRATCAEMSIKIIDIAVNTDHVHLFFQYPPKYSLSFIAKKIKRRSSRILRKEFPHLRDWCGDHLWAPGCYHGSVGQGWEVVEKYISTQNCEKTL